MPRLRYEDPIGGLSGPTGAHVVPEALPARPVPSPQGLRGSFPAGLPRLVPRMIQPRRPVPAQRRLRCSAIAAAVPPATAPTPAAAGRPTFAALRAVR